LSLAIFVCCADVGLCEDLSPVQGSPTECMFVCVCVCVSLSVIRCNNNPLHVQLVSRRGQTKKERKVIYYAALNDDDDDDNDNNNNNNTGKDSSSCNTSHLNSLGAR